VLTGQISFPNRQRIAELAVQNRLPAMFDLRPYADAGGLISYGADLADIWRQSARFVDQILKGAKPADLPVEQPTKFELVINLKTAKALGYQDSAGGTAAGGRGDPLRGSGRWGVETTGCSEVVHSTPA
jgi:ABC-type uncharacterized transport system substrate-binding protein